MGVHPSCPGSGRLLGSPRLLHPPPLPPSTHSTHAMGLPGLWGGEDGVRMFEVVARKFWKSGGVRMFEMVEWWCWWGRMVVVVEKDGSGGRSNCGAVAVVRKVMMEFVMVFVVV